jgi:hypothetical protein
MGKDVGGLHSEDVQKRDVEKAVDMGSAKRAEKRKELEYQMKILDKADKVEKRRSQPTTPTSSSKKPRVIAKTPIRPPIGRGSKGKEAAKRADKTADEDEDKDEDEDED